MIILLVLLFLFREYRNFITYIIGNSMNNMWFFLLEVIGWSFNQFWQRLIENKVDNIKVCMAIYMVKSMQYKLCICF